MVRRHHGRAHLIAAHHDLEKTCAGTPRQLLHALIVEAEARCVGRSGADTTHCGPQCRSETDQAKTTHSPQSDMKLTSFWRPARSRRHLRDEHASASLRTDRPVRGGGPESQTTASIGPIGHEPCKGRSRELQENDGWGRILECSVISSRTQSHAGGGHHGPPGSDRHPGPGRTSTSG
jgi:hypothetical protein